MALAAYRLIQPGRRFLVKFHDDPGFVHERVALWPLAASSAGGPALSFAVLTSGGHAYEEAFSDYSGLHVLDNASADYPGRFVRGADVVQFSVPLTDDELGMEIAAARNAVAATLGGRPQARAPAHVLTWGVPRSLFRASRSGTASPAPSAP